MFRPSIGHLFSLVNLIKLRVSYLDLLLDITAPLNLIRLEIPSTMVAVYYESVHHKLIHLPKLVLVANNLTHRCCCTDNSQSESQH